jgi:hypothetical protein
VGLRKKTRAGECEEEEHDRSTLILVTHSNRACPNQPPGSLYTRKPLNQRQVSFSATLGVPGADRIAQFNSFFNSFALARRGSRLVAPVGIRESSGITGTEFVHRRFGLFHGLTVLGMS